MAENQWKQLNDTSRRWLDDTSTLIGGNAGSAIKRLGLIAFRIAMILSNLRNAETGVFSNKIICTDTDFQIAMYLAETYKQHSLTMYKKLPQEKGRVQQIHKFEVKLEQQAIKLSKEGMSNRSIANLLEVSEGTIRNWLKGSA